MKQLIPFAKASGGNSLSFTSSASREHEHSESLHGWSLCARSGCRLPIYFPGSAEERPGGQSGVPDH